MCVYLALLDPVLLLFSRFLNHLGLPFSGLALDDNLSRHTLDDNDIDIMHIFIYFAVSE